MWQLYRYAAGGSRKRPLTFHCPSPGGEPLYRVAALQVGNKRLPETSPGIIFTHDSRAPATTTKYSLTPETANRPDLLRCHDEPDCFAHKAISDHTRHCSGFGDPKSFAARWAYV
jgi:hypothetical protein